MKWKIHHRRDFFMFVQRASSGWLRAVDCTRSYFQLTIIPVLTAMPRPQYVLGTMSPKPTLKNVIAISHIEFNKLACSSSWNLNWIFFWNQFLSFGLMTMRNVEKCFLSSFEGSECFRRAIKEPQRCSHLTTQLIHLIFQIIFYLLPFHKWA